MDKEAKRLSLAIETLEGYPWTQGQDGQAAIGVVKEFAAKAFNGPPGPDVITAGAIWEPKAWGEVAHIFYCANIGFSYLRTKEFTRCSRHYHRQRVNVFHVRAGIIVVEQWNQRGQQWNQMLFQGDTMAVPTLIEHRFRVLQSGIVVEIYHPERPGDAVSIHDINRRDVGGPDVD